uniref:Major facilitator superfamily (MFS) profile domain-containing protein n=1 Tax=Salarias fasciatus TaxID=181472 RepID=A0A672J4E9_SALFA
KLWPSWKMLTSFSYLQNFEAEPFFLGLTLSAFSLSGLLFGPLFGLYSDQTHTTKSVIVIAVVFQVAGNLMYFMGYSKWIVLSSRFVSGIGAGVGSSIFGFLTKVTASVDRASVFATVMACRQAGLLIGPGFNFFLRLCEFHLGPLVISKYNAPGLFMCLVWTCFTLVVIFLYSDLPLLEKMKPKDSLRGKSSQQENEQEVEEDKAESDEEEKPLIGPEELVGSYGSVVASNEINHRGLSASCNTPDRISACPSPVEAQTEESSSPFKNFSITQEFLREEVVVLLAAQFVILFNQTVLETMVTPLTQKLFSFGELENSFMYCLGGLVIIVGFVFVRWMTRCVEERVVLSIGLGLSNVACAWFLVFLANPQGSFAWQMAEFVVGFFLQVAALPFISVAQVSLFSKVTSEKTQGFSQGVRRSVGGLATILGPLWAGGLTDNMYIMMGVMMGLLVLLTVRKILFFKLQKSNWNK